LFSFSFRARLPSASDSREDWARPGGKGVVAEEVGRPRSHPKVAPPKRAMTIEAAAAQGSHRRGFGVSKVTASNATSGSTPVATKEMLPDFPLRAPVKLLRKRMTSWSKSRAV